ncbi:hypothetical protein Q31b_56560 [Novipirellula aureliae]|uniref:DUF2585 family protein n=1 Tax=Novipirellula aureliae TaxID=2527966 RepID=A0A5C6DD62_9BACT|nr:DUF2585 family protein [Novipirellula aureliae]TWU34185.1 hypothetical protein Q31b_56560 [Novipirellula aureliae]
MKFRHDRFNHLVVVLSGIATAMVVLLALMGRIWWCEAGDLSLWSWDVWSRHNSQHLLDPYSLSHLEHGLALWVIFSLAFRGKISRSSIFILIATIEAVWEVAENTPLMINRYREATISLDYTGDSILNSLSDYLMCLIGAIAAASFRLRASIVTVSILEVVCLFWIRDSLIVNMIMLIYPIDAIRIWQSESIPAIALIAK